jgi:hypothetical protein
MEANQWAISKINFKRVAKCQEYANLAEDGENRVVLFTYNYSTRGNTRTVDYLPDSDTTVHNFVSSPDFSHLMRTFTKKDCWCYTRNTPLDGKREVVMVVRSEYFDMPGLVTQ